MIEICRLRVYPTESGANLWVKTSLLRELGVDPTIRQNYAVLVEARTRKGVKVLVVKPAESLNHDDVVVR